MVATSRNLCPECKEERLVKRHGEYETVFTSRDEKSYPLIVPDLDWLQCEGCGEVVLDDHAEQLIDSARRKALGLLTPQEIRAVRTRLERTQAGMSALLGIGEKTYWRWESGSYIQSEASDRYLRLLIADPGNVKHLEAITEAKAGPELREVPAEDVRELFPYVRDLATTEERARFFVEQMEEGVLQVA